MSIINIVNDNKSSVTLIMYQVILALIPGIGAMVWWFGANVLIQISLAIITALITEALILRLRQREFIKTIFDGSGILTAILLAISIPPIAPWWLIVIGTFFAIVFGKQLYGGLGNNIFNPAMLGFVVLIISFPKQMTLWANVDLVNNLSVFEQIKLIFVAPQSFDAISGATPLGGLNTALIQGISANSFISETNLTAWTMINWGFFLGGVILLITKTIRWHIPVAYLLSLSAMALIFNLINPEVYPPLDFHLLMGATMLGAFFIATDPVSASTTNLGRLIYGAGIGFLIFIIRSFGSFHDAIAFAVIFMNIVVPLLDAYTKPKPFGSNNDE